LIKPKSNIDVVFRQASKYRQLFWAPVVICLDYNIMVLLLWNKSDVHKSIQANTEVRGQIFEEYANEPQNTVEPESEDEDESRSTYKQIMVASFICAMLSAGYGDDLNIDSVERFSM
jgi:hypothetical protein